MLYKTDKISIRCETDKPIRYKTLLVKSRAGRETIQKAKFA